MDKNAWALCIGHLILEMNSIDVMTFHCHRALTGKEPSKTWCDKNLETRLKGLKEKAPDDSKLQSILKHLIDEADSIRKNRNVVAHAWIAVDAQNPLKPGEQTKWLLYAKKHHDSMSFEDLVAATQKCQQLSNRLSEHIAAIEFIREPQ